MRLLETGQHQRGRVKNADGRIARSTAHLRMRESGQLFASRAPTLKEALADAASTSTAPSSKLTACPSRATTRKNTTQRGPKRLKVDLWWSGKHKRHRGNIQVVTAPDGWPL